MSVRQIVLDTETTGLEPVAGHRIIEIACVEIKARRFTNSNFHVYLNPERDSDEAALAIHGLTREFLSDKPRFEDVVGDLLAFIAGAQLLIHNAAFDEAFLDAELARCGRGRLRERCDEITDTLAMARELHPGKKNNLDALCERYAVDNSHRTLHGALLDARLLGDVYLAMTRGQDSLIMDFDETAASAASTRRAVSRGSLKVLRASDEELAAHAVMVAAIDKASKGKCLWKAIDESDAS